MPEAARTLVKSPPELWAEVSDPDALARHLGAFGDIRITRLDPEATVVWEGDRIRGTVDLAPAGWGTKVTVKAEEIEDAAAEPPADEAPQAAQLPSHLQPTVEIAAMQATPGPVPAEAAQPRRRLGLMGRLFGRRVEPAAPAPQRAAPTSEPAAPTPEPPAPPAPRPDTATVLDGMLGSLGAAHHRPYSR